MNELTLSEIAKTVSGKLKLPAGMPDFKINNIATDSRNFFRGETTLFFALTGPRHNGHNYIAELISRNVKAFVVSDEKYISGDAAFIVVKNTTTALQQLAAQHREQHQYPVLAITGSNGKTIVKEWLHELLSETFKIVRSPKSFNSQIGVPLSLLLMNKNYNLAIIEAGISQPGEMNNLAEIIKPEIGIMTNIGDAHQENFESRTQKTREKLLLFKNAKRLVFNADDATVEKLTSSFCDANSIEKISWSLKDKKARINFNPEVKIGETKITAKTGDLSYTFEIPFTDESAVENACHCFAAATVLLENSQQILPHFKKLAPVAMRLEIKKGTNNCLLVNDYYNSDLTSLSIALSVLQQQAKKGYAKKRVILSDIQQTGIPQRELYSRVNELLNEWQIDELIGIGPEIDSAGDQFSVPVITYNNVDRFYAAYNHNILSDSAILIKGAREFKFEQISALLQQKAHQTVLEINLNALANNLNVFRGLLKPETKIMVMVKAFSYGSGDTEVAKMLQFQQVDYLAVAVADEGVELRNAGIQTPIIVMNPEAHSFQHLIDYQLEPNIYSVELLQEFLKITSQNALQNFPVHLKIDTGMNRLGLKAELEINEVIALLKSESSLFVKSVFSHLAASDESTFDDFTNQQFEAFEKASEKISAVLDYPIDRHILNSAGIERFPEKQYDMVRLGIGLYGVSVSGLPLENVSTLKSTISQVKIVQSDETVGYGRKGTVQKETTIAVVPLGYADGLDRKLGNYNGHAIIWGQKVPIIGNVCMDMLMLDVTGINVEAGDEVEFFGAGISIEEVAEKAGTIPYEVLTGISQRVKRIYLHE